MGVLQAVVDHADHDAGALDAVPGRRHPGILARGARLLSRVLQVPLLGKERVIGHESLLLLSINRCVCRIGRHHDRRRIRRRRPGLRGRGGGRRGLLPSGLRHQRYRVGSGGQPAEGVAAVARGQGARFARGGRPVTIQIEVHRPAGGARLGRLVPGAVAVGIVPGETGDGGQNRRRGRAAADDDGVEKRPLRGGGERDRRVGLSARELQRLRLEGGCQRGRIRHRLRGQARDCDRDVALHRAPALDVE